MDTQGYSDCRIYGLDFDDSTESAENEDDEDLTPFERRAKRMTPQEGLDGLRKRVCMYNFLFIP